MKKIVSAIIICTFCLSAQDPSLQLNNNNNQTIEQNITITLDKKNLTDCTQFQGVALKECMACQSDVSFRQNMKALTDHTALSYWKSLDLNEYTDALLRYDNEQWLEFYASRTPQGKNLFIPNLQVLKRRIKLIYVSAYYYWVGSYILSGQDHDKVDDLRDFIRSYEYSLRYGTILPFNDWKLHRDFQAIKNDSFGPQKSNVKREPQ